MLNDTTGAVVHRGVVVNGVSQATLRRWLTRILAVLGAAGLIATYIRSVSPPGVDYVAYYDAGGWIRAGARLYERSLIWRDVGYAPEYPMPMPDGMQFVYPPVFAFAFSPLTLLPVDTAFAMWLGVLFAALMGATWLLLRLLLPKHMSPSLSIVLAAAAAAAFFQPMRTILITGQVDVVILLLLVLALRAFVRGEDIQVGLWLALAVAIKPTLGFLVLFLVWKRAYRAVVACGVVAFVLLAVPFIGAGGTPTVLDYVAVSGFLSSVAFDVSPINQSPYGMLLRLFTVNAYTVPVLVAPLLPLVGRALLTVGTLGALAWMVCRSRDIPVHQQALEYSLFIIGLLLAGPLSEAGHYGYLLLPLAAVAIGVIADTTGPRMRIPTAVALLALFAYLCLPSLTPMDLAFFAYWQEPVRGLKLVMTGMHLYGLLGVAALTMATLASTARFGSPRRESA